jgi:hypothetical protein
MNLHTTVVRNEYIGKIRKEKYVMLKYRKFHKELYNFESLYKFTQRTYTVF